jgi:hypothetical protein
MSTTPEKKTQAPKLNTRPFVFERGTLIGNVRAWGPSKPTDKNREQITVAIGSVGARIAGSTVTYPMDVQIVFADKTATPDVVLRQPWHGFAIGGKPLFEADDDASAKELADSFGSIVDQYLAWYEKQPAENRLDLKTIDYPTAAALIKAKTGGVRRSLTR